MKCLFHLAIHLCPSSTAQYPRPPKRSPVDLDRVMFKNVLWQMVPPSIIRTPLCILLFCRMLPLRMDASWITNAESALRLLATPAPFNNGTRMLAASLAKKLKANPETAMNEAIAAAPGAWCGCRLSSAGSPFQSPF